MVAAKADISFVACAAKHTPHIQTLLHSTPTHLNGEIRSCRGFVELEGGRVPIRQNLNANTSHEAFTEGRRAKAHITLSVQWPCKAAAWGVAERWWRRKRARAGVAGQRRHGASKTSPRTLNGACAGGARRRRGARQRRGAAAASKTSPHGALQGGGTERQKRAHARSWERARGVTGRRRCWAPKLRLRTLNGACAGDGITMEDGKPTQRHLDACLARIKVKIQRRKMPEDVCWLQEGGVAHNCRVFKVIVDEGDGLWPWAVGVARQEPCHTVTGD
ncbi:hypothetical protein GGX14DRAFT_652184 [Mycena pura]|uniref:Uncharacterized protein n=1 Tax=Mycena pura TaxID=153505 RepID=A0AAD6YD41_9AGAR|nr:hypothetical protein GGX14DRAFT_652184 [Mycena pura]